MPPEPNAPSTEARTATKARARAQFEKWALSYDRSWLNELVFFPSIRRCLTEILTWQAARDSQTFRMLDVGCGTGSLLSVAAGIEGAERLIGLDYAEEMVHRAHEKFAGSPHAARLLAMHGDAEHLPLANACVDVVTCCNSFHHYPHQPAAIAEFHRVLRPGGMLILIDGFRDNVIGWVIFDVGVALAEGRVHHAPWSKVRGMIEAARFQALRQEKMNVLAPLLVSVATT